MKIEYRDYLGNSRAEAFSKVSVITFDTFTEPIRIISPTTGNTFREAFPLQFQLSEEATQNTVKMTFTHTGGEVDADSPHVVVFSVTDGQTYDTTMAALSNLTQSNNIVTSSSTADLKHHAIYDISMTYQDFAGNVPVTFTAANMKFDTFTEAPVLISPASNTFIAEIFVFSFTLPEKALPGSVKLSISFTSSVRQFTPVNTRLIVFNSSMVVEAGTYSIQIPTISILASAVPEVQSVSPSTDLVDGAVYSFLLEYQDIAGNTKATALSSNVGFAGSSTQVAQLNSPLSLNSIPKTWSLDVVLYEAMSSCNISIVTTPVAPVMRDVVAFRLIQLSEEALTPGSHIYTMYELFELVDRSSDVDTVSPPDNLVIGALYSIQLTCSDAVGNDAVTVEANQVEFAGNKTLVPMFMEPYPLQSR